LLQAQNDLTAALVAHTIAKLTFFRDVGLLQVRPDGMWREPHIPPRATVRAPSGEVVPAPQALPPGRSPDYRDFLGVSTGFWRSL